MSGIPVRKAPPLSHPTTTIAGAAVAAHLATTTVRQPHPNANRKAMPIIASVVDQLRQAFGADQVRVAYVEEAGRKLGTPQPPGVKPVITGAGAPKRPTGKEARS